MTSAALMSERRLRNLDIVDAMPAELRSCVHEFGLPIVEAFRRHGVNRSAAIREIIREVWNGPRQEGQRRSAHDVLDVLLAQSGSNLNARALRRILAENHIAIVTVEPTKAMVDASEAEVAGFNVRCTRTEKHRRRLRAALRSGMAESLK